MKALGVISTTAIFLLLGATIPAFAQEEHHEEAAKPAEHQEAAKPAKQEEAKPAKQQESQPKPAKQQEQAKAEKQQPAAKPAKQENQAKPAKQEQAKSEKPQPAAKTAKQENQAKPAKQEQAKSEKQQEPGNNGGQHGQPQRSAEAQQRQRSAPALRLSARGSGRIPDDRFRTNFGAEHVFVINEPVMVGGFSRFQYGGFWFGFENPWPEGWYYTDNVYVDYIDGEYYLCNPYYPGVHVGISVVI